MEGNNYINCELDTRDKDLALDILGGKLRKPDLTIAPDGQPYIYRWHIVRSPLACVYFHIQIASDPERPLHDHPWDNTSVILRNGYDELWNPDPACDLGPGVEYGIMTRKLREGACVHRLASEAHRLLLPPEYKYTMSLFSTGPKVRDWGFWYRHGWVPFTDVTSLDSNGVSRHIKPDSEWDGHHESF